MSQGEDAGASVTLPTARGRDYPTIRQFTVFLENRVGQLLEVLRRFRGSDVRIVALNILDSTECSIVRFVLTMPEQGREVLERAGLAMIESDLIALELPDDPQPLLQVCSALLQAEVNLVQTYPLMIRASDRIAVALMVDNIDQAQETLATRGFKLLSEQQLLDLC
ncbi:MAG TPA: acetolactate synthase [Pirellulaceae bacterium]|nr:acetolactate synthase [Pirellulaceae bacterium]